MEKIVTKRNDEMREITSIVLVPGVADWHDEIYDEVEVLKAERNFSEFCYKANLQHELQLDSDQAKFVESYILPSDMIYDGRVVKKGTWLATLKIKSDSLWEAVKEGTFKGFSIGCKTKVERIVAKAKGNYEGDLGRVATKRLSDFNFKEEFCHVALVTEGANGSDILVMKAKKQEHRQTPEQPQQDDSQESVKTKKDDNMSDITQEEYDAIKAREVELLQEVEAIKAKAEADAILAEEVEALKAKAKEDEEALEAFKAKEEEALKAKEEAEKADFVAKAKSLDAVCSSEAHEEFGADMYLFKSLAPESFERVMKHLEQADANLKNSEYVFKEVGSTEEADLSDTLEGEELITAKAKKLVEKDPSLNMRDARIAVRKEQRSSK